MRGNGNFAVWLVLAVILVVAIPYVEAQAARVSVSVKDAEGKPVEGATLTATCSDRPDYEAVKVANKKGKIAITHMESLLTYRYEIAKEGFQIQVTQVRPDYTETTRVEIVLHRLEQAATSNEGGPTSSGRGRAFEAFNEGAEAQERGDLDLAEKKFRQAAELSPDAAEPHIALAVVAHQRGDYSSAASEAEAALAISPNNQQAMILRLDAYRILGDADKAAEAAEILRREGDISVVAVTAFNEGLEEHRGGNCEVAVEKFRQAIELDPEMTNGYLMLGSIALDAGDPTQAAALASKALETDPGNINALMIRYDAARQLGNTESARTALDALIGADPEWAATDLFNHAVELYNSDEMASAAVALEKVVELQPDDAKARFLLGMARYNLGETEDAKEHLTRFLELAPDDPDAALAQEMLKYASQ